MKADMRTIAEQDRRTNSTAYTTLDLNLCCHNFSQTLPHTSSGTLFRLISGQYTVLVLYFNLVPFPSRYRLFSFLIYTNVIAVLSTCIRYLLRSKEEGNTTSILYRLDTPAGICNMTFIQRGSMTLWS